MKTSMESRYYEKVGHVADPKQFPSLVHHPQQAEQHQLTFPYQQFQQQHQQQQHQLQKQNRPFNDRSTGQHFSNANHPEPTFPNQYIQQNPKTYPHQLQLQQQQQHYGNRNMMAPSSMCPPQMMQGGGGGNGGGDNSFGGGGFQLKQNNGYFYNTGHPMGTLSNPLINIPEGFRPNIGLSRDEMKDKLAESLATDSNISCLPGFKPRNDTRLNCAGQFPYALDPNPIVTNQRRMFGQERPSSPIRRSQAVMGKLDFPGGESKFQGLEKMSSIPNGQQAVIHPSLQSPAGISSSLTNQMSQLQSNFRRGTMGTWASLGTPGPNSTSVQEAKAIKAGYRQELEKQIEQAKLRKQEEERREKDINDHPLGANYAQPKQYIPSKFLPQNLTSMEIAQRMIRSEPRDPVEPSKNNSCCSESSRSMLPPANKPNLLSRDSSYMQKQSQPPTGGGTGRPNNCAGTAGSNVNYSNNETSWTSPNPNPASSPPNAPQTSPAQMQPQPWPIYPTPPMIPFPSPYPPQYFHQPQPAYPPPPPPPMLFNLPPYPQATSPTPAQSCSWQASSTNLHGGFEGSNKNHSAASRAENSNMSKVSKTNTANSQNLEESYLESEFENFDQLMEGMPLKQYTWQTSDQLPDPALKTAIYKEELRRQIIQKKKDEEEKAQRERDEEEKLERKIREYDDRMRREVTQEKNRNFVKAPAQPSQPREQASSMHRSEFSGVSERERLEAQIQEKNKLSQKQRSSREKHSTQTFEHKIEAGGDASITSPDRSPRTASPPVPSVKKRLETQSESSLLNKESKSGRNLHALSDILNSLGLEKQRMERVIKRKLNLH